MALKRRSDTYVRSIWDEGREYTVVYRHLSGWQKDRIRSMQVGDDGPYMDPGSIKMRTIEEAVVSWTLPFELTRENIKELEQDVFDRLAEYVNLDGPEVPEQLDAPDVPLGDEPSSSPSGESGENGS